MVQGFEETHMLAEGTIAAEEFQSQTRFGSLDGLRFFCIAAVLWHHSEARETFGDPTSLASRGFLGVDFFFVLSGFLITTILLREEAKTGRFSLRAFYWRRILRIVPVYFLVIFLAAAYSVVVKGQMEDLYKVPWYLLFMGNFINGHIPILSPTWSLGVEEQYYLIWPLLLLILPRRMVLPVLILLIAVNVAGIMGVFVPLGINAIDWGNLHFALPNATYAPILMGSVLAVVLNRRSAFCYLWPVFGARGAPLIALVFLILVIKLSPADLRGYPNLAIHLSMTAMLLALVIREDNIMSPVMRYRPIARIGEISYGIYLYHLFALSLVDGLARHAGISSPWLKLLTYVPLSILMAEISFRTYEAYFRSLRHKRPRRVAAV